MNSLEFGERWLAASEVAELESLARDIGFALPAMSSPALRDFLGQFGPGAEATENPIVKMFRATAIEILASYETALSASDAERSAESLVLHEGWRKILNELAKGPVGPSELAAVLGVSKSHMSRALSAMRRADLVEVSPSTSAKERPHRLTSLGSRMEERLNEETNALPSPLEAERAEIEALVLRPLTNLRFRTSRELLFYVGLLYLSIDAITNDPERRIDDYTALREIRRLLLELPTGVYAFGKNVIPQGTTQEVLALLRERVIQPQFCVEFQQHLLGVGRRLPRQSSTALVWCCIAADWAASFVHKSSLSTDLRPLGLSLLEQHHVPLALWCRGQLQRYTDLPRIRAGMREAAVIEGASDAPELLVERLQATQDASLFLADPSADALPLSNEPRKDFAKRLIQEARTIEAISIVGSDGWLSDDYHDVNCQSARNKHAKIRRLVVVENKAKFLKDRSFARERELLYQQSRANIELRLIERHRAQQCSQQTLENILVWNEQTMTTSRDEGEATWDQRQVREALESWNRMWEVATEYRPSQPSRPSQPAEAGPI